MKRTSLLALLAVAVAQPNATITITCPGQIQFDKNFTISPQPPVAGSTVYVNASGITTNTQIITGGAAEVDGFVFGSELFTAPFNTCGLGQQIDVLGLTTATVDSINCPVAKGSRVRIGVVIPIPDEAGGLGDIQVNVYANDTAAMQVFCLQLNLSL